MAMKGKFKGNRDKRRVVRMVAEAILLLFVSFVLAFTTYTAHLAADTENVSYDSIYAHIEKTSILYDADGHEIDRLYYGEDRELAKYDDLPENLKNAFIAIEDKTFWKHHGFNFKRMAGAVIYKLLGKSDAIRGTSTITQQLARNVYLSDIKSERTVKRKLTEAVYAAKIERALSKEQILEAYLNTIYLGYGCYGVDSAATTYYSKKVPDLSLTECASLAALTSAPDAYALLKDEEGDATTYLDDDGIYANDASKERRNLVLDLMTEQGYVSADDAAASKVEIKDALKPDLGNAKSSKYTYFTDYVASAVAKDLAEQYDLSEETADRMVHTGGLQIHSTLEPDIQKIINREFENDSNFPAQSEETPQAAMVVTEVGTGNILAMSGGRGASGKKLFNRAISPRQPGSSIKPLSVYSAALQKSYEFNAEGRKFPFTDFGYDKQGASGWGDYITASSPVKDEKMYVEGRLWPLNATRSYSGDRTFRAALEQSINTCAVKIQRQVGNDYSMDMLKKYGITTAVDDETLATNDLNPAAMALGAMSYGVTPLEMACAYAVFPNGGVRCSPACYTKVTDSEGSVVLESRPEQVQVIDEGVAFIMTDCLKGCVSHGIAGSAAINGASVGGKTGTTNDEYDIWFCGFTPKYSAALWIGTDHNKTLNSLSTTAAALWSTVMRQVPGINEGDYPPQPSDVIRVDGEYYTKGTEKGRVVIKKEKKKEKPEDDDDGLTGEEWARRWLEEDGDGSDSGSSEINADSDSDADDDAEEWLNDFFSDN